MKGEKSTDTKKLLLRDILKYVSQVREEMAFG
jgi:hypothetical protein